MTGVDASRIITATDGIVAYWQANPCHTPDLTPLYPTIYRASHVLRYLQSLETDSLLVLGMNPSPHGQGQTGIAFTDLPTVRLFCPDEPGTPPDQTHTRHRLADPLPDPARLGRWRYDEGFGDRQEESGQRLWRALGEIIDPGKVIGKGVSIEIRRRVSMFNVLPVLYVDRDGNNVSMSDKRKRVTPHSGHYEQMSKYLRQLRTALSPRDVIATGSWAATQAMRAYGMVKSITHPSPATGLSETAWAMKAGPGLKAALK